MLTEPWSCLRRIPNPKEFVTEILACEKSLILLSHHMSSFYEWKAGTEAVPKEIHWTEVMTAAEHGRLRTG